MSRKSMPLLDQEPAKELVGTLERVVFHNSENGFTVLRIAPENQAAADLVSCVGHIANPRMGARLKLNGRFVANPRYGRQFSFETCEEVMPATENDIRAYLASGLIKGVGATLAEQIVKKFGRNTIHILDTDPQQLASVRGIGKKNLQTIIDCWNEHRSMRDLLLFLQPHGISAPYAVRIYRAYGTEAMKVVSENPYRMAMDVRGIGFLTADSIASKLGFAQDHPLRIQAAALYILQRASEDGHVFLPESELVEKMARQVEASPELALAALKELERDKRIVRESATDEAPVYLSRFYHCESKTSYYLKRLLNSPKAVRFAEVDKSLADALASLDVQLAPQQVRAVQTAAKSKIMVITGGPGTGKTTIIKAVIKTFQSVRAKILLAAPTGRAAKRMSEACGHEARTIHRLLEYNPGEDCFGRNEDNPLACGLLVVDEASMMDTLLFYYLLKALPLGATLVLVGDVHQLPSVGPGNVLGDIIGSRAVPVVELNEIFRQSAESNIICNAHLINQGKMPLVERTSQRLSDFYFIPRDDPEQAADVIVDMIKNRIPARFSLDPVNEVQLLTPMHKGAVGAEQMNRRLQEALNPNGLEVRRGEKSFRLHDKVMQVRNNYEKDIFNGDIGRIVYLDPRQRTLSVNFDGTVMPYEFDELDELVPAYAISIHKSQGSEYPAVVIPIMMQHYILLQRNLIYTGVTRGKSLVVLVGESKALRIAIANNNTGKRHTRLAERLQILD